MIKNKFCLFAFTALFSTATYADTIIPGYTTDLQVGSKNMATVVSGSGYTANVGGPASTSYLVDFGYAWTRGVRIHVGYSSASTNFRSPTGATPATFKVTQTDTELYSLFQVRETSDLKLGLGYKGTGYNADSVSPVAVTTQRVQGLKLLVEDDFTFTDNWSLTARGEIFLPHSISESTTYTGYSPNYMGYVIGSRLNWRLSEVALINLGVYYRSDRVNYVGTGTRGTTNGIDTRNTTFIPLGIRFEY
jgi:hypothetical protein